MKTPLRYQATSFDCGTTSFVNALMYLFEREEIPPEVVKYITCVTCDHHYADHGGAGGTSYHALAFLATWLNNYAQRFGMPIRCEAMRGEEVNVGAGSRVEACLAQGGAAVAGCWLGVDHYVLLTGINDEHVQLFDPFYEWPITTFKIEVVGTQPVWDKPFSHNREVERWVLDAPYGTPYSLSAKTGREAFLIWRTDKPTA